ncbi:MaoC family dehydratase [candidate division KSB1 bacterium]
MTAKTGEQNGFPAPDELSFDDISIGRTAQFTHVVTEEDVTRFSDITGDRNPLHHDDNYARESGFDDRIIQGLLTASLLSRLVGMHIPGKQALYHAQDMKFIRPVSIGDTLTIKGTVTEKFTERYNMIILKTEIFNQDGSLVLSGTAKTSVRDSQFT